MRRILVSAIIAMGTRASALPSTGDELPAVLVDDLAGHTRSLPDRKTPVVVIYEDANAGTQNPPANHLISKTTGLAENRGKLEAVPVADLGRWNWWPAKRFAAAEVRRIATKERTIIYADWTGAVRKAWRLTRGKSGIIAIGVDGRVRFAGEGPLSTAQLADLAAAFRTLGLDVPDVSRDVPALIHAPPDLGQRPPFR